MLDRLRNNFNSSRLKQLTDISNIVFYTFALIVLAIAWSGVRTVQSNFELQKRISTLKQENTVLRLQNENTILQNKYFETDDYLDLSARQDLGLAGPGEKVMLIPKSVALKYIDQTLAPSPTSSNLIENRSKYLKNLENWRDFLLGRKMLGDEPGQD